MQIVSLFRSRRKPQIEFLARVTRLGEFSPIGQVCLLWAVDLNMTELVQSFGFLFSKVKVTD
jgi:hypothetical protein